MKLPWTTDPADHTNCLKTYVCSHHNIIWKVTQPCFQQNCSILQKLSETT